MITRIVRTVALLSLFTVLPIIVCAQSELSQFLEPISALEERGDFEQASKNISSFLAEKSSTLSSDEKMQLEWEHERLWRIRQDYSLTQSDLIKGLEKRVKDFRSEEFNNWKAQGWFDSQTIDGQEYFVGPSVSNLFFRHPELRERDADRKEKDEFALSVWRYYSKLARLAEGSSDQLINPRQVRVKMSITVNKDAVAAGSVVRCWMPYPRVCPLQSGIQLLSSSPNPLWVDRPDSLMRSLYFERKAVEGKPTAFSAQYTYTCSSFYKGVAPARVIPFDTTDHEYVYYTSERPPHIVFFPELQQLSQEIVRGETNPYLKAKKIYNWITRTIKYSYAREYSTLRNISKYVYDHRYGDCGQEALLFITLCRMNGIPARWQSGWVAFPTETNMHDWSEIFIPPYGWLPVDVWAGIYFVDEARSISEQQKRALADFYFGNLDHFRLIVNNDHSVPLFPTKQSFRSDTVDFQRGELEANGKNIYYNNFSYKLEIKAVE